jgi:hypothetical protein
MAPKRNAHNLPKKSVWDEVLLEEFFHDAKKRAKMWKWIIYHPDADLADVPLEVWCVPKKTCQTVVQEYHKIHHNHRQEHKSSIYRSLDDTLSDCCSPCSEIPRNQTPTIPIEGKEK